MKKFTQKAIDKFGEVFQKNYDLTTEIVEIESDLNFPLLFETLLIEWERHLMMDAPRGFNLIGVRAEAQKPFATVGSLVEFAVDRYVKSL